MIIINVDHGESIDKVLKRYKNKHRSIKVMDQIKERKFYTKKSIKRRNEILKASYKNRKSNEIESK